ncbi:MAG: hypothetical protein R3321_02515, partial [Nitrososphaeraceae archaeon]|nr:hypothetical protein [Nitrososphaeraceae archaeon]
MRLKIAIIGIPGSGKSTLAKELSETLNLQHYPEPILPTEYYSSMPNWAITREISRLLFLRHRNSTGVFECLPGYNKYIFLDREEMIRVNQVCNLREYSHIFALNPSIDIVRERILKRNRTNLVSIEIENTHLRYI